MSLDSDALLRLVSKGEGRELEFKRELPVPLRLARSLCAFANTRGGRLLVGVEDDGLIVGVDRPRQVPRILRACATNDIEPPLEPLITSVTVEERVVICCEVRVSDERPHRVRRKDGEWEVVVRVGASSRRASRETLRALSRRPASSGRSLDTLEKRVLEWIEHFTRRNSRPGGGATIQAFSRAQNIGRKRAERAFLALEAKGYLVSHGTGTGQIFNLL